MAADAGWDWNIAVFCQNERWSIGRCIDGIANASLGRRVLTTLIVNGSSDDSAAVAWETARRRGVALAVWTIPYGDKANAINQFIYRLREPAGSYVFLDAYVKIGPNALAALDGCLAAHPEAVAATGVAVNGRTMREHMVPTLTEGGRLHGQLHALRPDFVDRFVARKLRIPLGLYYGDGLMGSMAMHDLDPVNIEWDQSRIASRADATYEIPELSLFRARDLKRQFRRKIRQMRGRLESLAIKAIVYTDGYEGLPDDAAAMVEAYLAGHGSPRTGLLDRVFQELAIDQVRRFHRPEPGALEPALADRIG